jgi:ABC-type transporter Mla subunit MlaD
MKIHAKQIDEVSLSSLVSSIVTGVTEPLEESLDNLELYFNQLSGSVSLISGNLDDLSDSFFDHSGRLDTIESELNDNQSFLNILSGNVNTLSGDIFAISGLTFSALNSFQSSLDSYEDDLIDFNVQLNALESGVSETLANFSSQINDIDSTLSDISGAQLLKNNNLSDLQSIASGQRNLNVQKQYMFLEPRKFILTDTTISPDTYAVPTGYVHGLPTGNTLTRIHQQVLSFGKNATALGTSLTNKIDAWCLFAFPNNWDKRAVYPKVYCTTTGAGTNVDVCWGLVGEFYGAGQRLLGSGSASEFHNVIVNLSNASTISGILGVGPSPVSGMWITGAPSGDPGFDHLCVLKIRRRDIVGVDTLGANIAAMLLGVGIEYSITGTISPTWAS